MFDWLLKIRLRLVNGWFLVLYKNYIGGVIKNFLYRSFQKLPVHTDLQKLPICCTCLWATVRLNLVRWWGLHLIWHPTHSVSGRLGSMNCISPRGIFDGDGNLVAGPYLSTRSYTNHETDLKCVSKTWQFSNYIKRKTCRESNRHLLKAVTICGGVLYDWFRFRVDTVVSRVGFQNTDTIHSKHFPKSTLKVQEGFTFFFFHYYFKGILFHCLWQNNILYN